VQAGSEELEEHGALGPQSWQAPHTEEALMPGWPGQECGLQLPRCWGVLPSPHAFLTSESGNGKDALYRGHVRAGTGGSTLTMARVPASHLLPFS